MEQQGGHGGGGRAWGVGAPPTSWPPLLCLDIGSKSPRSSSLRKSRSRRFHSVWTPFDISFLIIWGSSGEDHDENVEWL